MYKRISTTAALVLALGVSHGAIAQNQGQGQGRGGDRAEQDKGGGRGADKAARADNRGQGGGEGRQDRGPERQVRQDNPGRGQGQVQRAEREVRQAQAAVRDVVRPNADRGQGRGRDDDRNERGPVIRADGDRLVAFFRPEPDRGLIAGCPPGLAKRNNGCLPPGQERQIARARYDYLWGLRDPNALYRYDDGYLYRIDRSGSVLGWLPVLGGALSPGNVWPTQYAYQPAPPYYADYFRLGDAYDYRYAGGTLYAVDPRTQAISQVAALLTGQPWTVGQPMPAGYDVYNVPYAYRSRYVDGPDGLYRYSDGYVYQVDPTTQLVMAAIQLLT